MDYIARNHLAVAFGHTLRHARKQLHYSQWHVADLAGLDRTTPSLYERGLRCPCLDVVCALAQALGISAPELVSATLARLKS
jgi:transcriptional regulator with XRE-family HTH domain